MKSPTSKRKPQPRYGRLDGKPPSRPRGRNAVPRSEDEPERKVVMVPMNQRLGFRTSEFARLCGVSVVTVWRQIRDGKIEVVEIGGVKLIPRAYAIQRGLITSDDTI